VTPEDWKGWGRVFDAAVSEWNYGYLGMMQAVARECHAIAGERTAAEWQAAPDREAKRALADGLQQLRADARLPGLQAIADRIRQQGGTAGKSTVSVAMAGKSLPSWATLKDIVTVLDGDVEHFRGLWMAAHGRRREPQP
jgi:hypothetical protein